MKITIEYLENPQHEFHHHWCVIVNGTVIAAVPNYLPPETQENILGSVVDGYKIMERVKPQKLVG